MTVTSDEVVYLGVYVVNEVPPPVRYQFLDSDGNPVDLSDFDSGDISFHYRRSRDTTEVDRTDATLVSPGTAGTAEYAWVAADFASPGIQPGTYYARFFANNGTNAYASARLVYEVKAFL